MPEGDFRASSEGRAMVEGSSGGCVEEDGLDFFFFFFLSMPAPFSFKAPPVAVV